LKHLATVYSKIFLEQLRREILTFREQGIERAGIVVDPMHYKWSGDGEDAGESCRERRGLCQALNRPQDWVWKRHVDGAACSGVKELRNSFLSIVERNWTSRWLRLTLGKHRSIPSADQWNSYPQKHAHRTPTFFHEMDDHKYGGLYRVRDCDRLFSRELDRWAFCFDGPEVPDAGAQHAHRFLCRWFSRRSDLSGSSDLGACCWRFLLSRSTHGRDVIYAFSFLSL
jgi:hypothetical protein